MQRLPGGGHVLFRLDGLIVSISDRVARFLNVPVELPIEQHCEAITTADGESLAAASENALSGLVESGLLSLEAPTAIERTRQHASPSTLMLMGTQACNLACGYCYGGGGAYSGTPSFMKLQMAARAVDRLLVESPSRRKFQVVFFGGEPLLDMPLVRGVVAYCRALQRLGRYAFAFSVTTNGTLLTEEVLDFLKRERFALMVSYDGLGHDHRPFRGGRSSKKAVQRALIRLARRRIPFQLRATLTRDAINRPALEHLSKVGERLGCTVITTPAMAPRA
jgi:uncharacterized protein